MPPTQLRKNSPRKLSFKILTNTTKVKYSLLRDIIAKEDWGSSQGQRQEERVCHQRRQIQVH